MNNSNSDTRRGYIAGLRQLADILEQHDQLPLPYHGSSVPLTFMFFNHGEDNRAALANAVRAIPGRLDKNARDNGYFDVDGQLHGLKIQFTAYRDEVCERIVTGTTEVTREVPDPDALAKVPTTTVTETVEQVEWRCHPLLAGQSADETAVA